MTRTTPITLFFLILILTGIPVFGEDFHASAAQAVISACQCQEVTNLITVRNTDAPKEGLTVIISNGDQEIQTTASASQSAYTVTQDGKAATWSTLIPGFFTLASAESQVIEDIITIPCDAKGTFPLTTTITTQSGLIKVMDQTVEVKSCSNLQISSTNTRAESCPCSPIQYEFTITNPGSFQDTYLIGANGKETDYLTFSENTVTLKPGESRLIYAFFNTPCSLHGEFGFDVLVQSQRNMQTEKLPMQAGISPCYDFDVATGNLVRLQDRNASFQSFQGVYGICEKEPHLLIPVRITNTADITNDYLITLDGPKWASLTHNAVLQLSKDEYSEIFIVLEPWAFLEEDVTLGLEVRTAIGDMRESFEIPLSVDWCSTPRLFEGIEKISVNYSVISTLLPIENAGSRPETYDLSINLDWASIEPSELTLGPGESADVELITFPTEGSLSGRYDALVSADARSTGTSYEKEISVRLTEGSLWARLNGATAGYLLYILIGLILLIIIIVLLLLGGNKGAIEEKGEEKEEEKEVEKITQKKTERDQQDICRTAEEPSGKGSSFWKWCCIILIILLILAGAWFALSRLDMAEKVKAWLSSNETAQVNETEVIPEEPIEGDDGSFMSGLIDPILGFFTVYLWYILIGILLAIIIIILLSLGSKKEEKPEEKPVEKKSEMEITVDEEPVIVETKAKTKKVKKKPVSEPAEKEKPKGKLGWVIFSLLLLAIILIIAWRFGYSWYTQQAVEEEIIPTVDFSGVDCLETWPKNTEKDINLTIGFSDPDGDPLIFSSNDPENVGVFIDDRGIATIVPEEDFTGVVEIVFYAEDGRGFSIPTGNLSLCISDEEIDPITKAKDFALKNKTVLIIAGVILFLILLFIIFNKPIIRFLEEDDEIPPKKRSPKH